MLLMVCWTALEEPRPNFHHGDRGGDADDDAKGRKGCSGYIAP